MNALRLYFRWVGVSIRAQLQYRANVVLQTLGGLVLTGVEFLALWALFARFGHIAGWRLSEAALLYGMANVSFALSEAFARGFDVFDQLVRGGDFDRLLLRPRAAAFQVIAGQLQLMRAGRLLQGLAVLGWAVGAQETPPGAGQIALLAATVLSGALLFSGLFILQATLCFFSTQSLEVMNVTTYGGVEASQVPLSIYEPWFRRFFTFVVPLAAVNYFPALAILDRPGEGIPEIVPWIAPIAGPMFLLASLLVWRLGVRKYRSTGT